MCCISLSFFFFFFSFFFFMIRLPPRSTPLYSSAASDVYKRQLPRSGTTHLLNLIASDSRLKSIPYWQSLRPFQEKLIDLNNDIDSRQEVAFEELSLIHISEPTRLRRTSYAVFCLKKTKFSTPHLPYLYTLLTLTLYTYSLSPSQTLTLLIFFTYLPHPLFI